VATTNVLFTCVGRRNYLVGYFREVPGVRAIGADMDINAPAMAVCDSRHVVPAVSAPDYIDAVVALCEREAVDLVVSLNDHELPVLARARGRIESTGARLLVSSPEVVDRCFDKRESARWLESLGIDTPRTLTDLDAARTELAEGRLAFPLIVKPRWGSASAAVHRVHDLDEMAQAFALVSSQCRREGGLPPEALEPDAPTLIQQAARGDEYGLDVLNDLEGVTRTVFVKQKLGMRAGETDRACLRDRPDLVALGERLGRTLGHVGNLDCDVFVDGETLCVLELNPRFGGGYPFSQQAGADYPRTIIGWLRGEAVDVDGFERRFDEVYAKADTLIHVGRDAR